MISALNVPIAPAASHAFDLEVTAITARDDLETGFLQCLTGGIESRIASRASRLGAEGAGDLLPSRTVVFSLCQQSPGQHMRDLVQDRVAPGLW